jgi:hypothetical protein
MVDKTPTQTLDASRAIAAVRKLHGGFDAATETQCLAIWHSLSPKKQQAYLEQFEKLTKIADSPTSRK